MNQNLTKGIITVVVVAAVGYLAYKYLLLKKDKRFYAQTIINEGYYTSGIENLMKAFDEDFLKEWAKAAKKGNASFEYQGMVYNTQGGRVKKS